MSNDVIQSIQKSLATMKRGVDEMTAAVAGGLGVKRISIKGSVFRKYSDGKEVAAVPERFMPIIFVKAAPDPSRMYYPGAFEEGKKTSPACWSTDAKTPDKDVKTPVHADCKNCPMSVKGSGRDGKTSACRINWRTAVVLPNDIDGDVMQLVIPGASVWGDEFNGGRPFKPYSRYLASNNISLGFVVTKMEFDLRKPSPTLLFSPYAALTEDEIDRAALRGKSKEAELAVTLNVYQSDTLAAADEEDVPAHEAAAPSVAQAEAVPEPTLREEKGPAAEPPPAEKEVSAVIKKWAKK